MSARAWDRRRNKARPRWVRVRYGCYELSIGRPSGGVTFTMQWEPSNG